MQIAIGFLQRQCERLQEALSTGTSIFNACLTKTIQRRQFSSYSSRMKHSQAERLKSIKSRLRITAIRRIILQGGLGWLALWFMDEGHRWRHNKTKFFRKHKTAADRGAGTGFSLPRQWFRTNMKQNMPIAIIGRVGTSNNLLAKSKNWIRTRVCAGKIHIEARPSYYGFIKKTGKPQVVRRIVLHDHCLMLLCRLREIDWIQATKSDTHNPKTTLVRWVVVFVSYYQNWKKKAQWSLNEFLWQSNLIRHKNVQSRELIKPSPRKVTHCLTII